MHILRVWILNGVKSVGEDPKQPLTHIKRLLHKSIILYHLGFPTTNKCINSALCQIQHKFVNPGSDYEHVQEMLYFQAFSSLGRRCCRRVCLFFLFERHFQIFENVSGVNITQCNLNSIY